MKIRLLLVFLLLFAYGCDGGGGGASGGSGSVQQLSANNIVGDWNVSEFYKNGETKQWTVRFINNGSISGGGSYTFSEDNLIIQNPYSYWVASDLSNFKHFVAYGPISNLHFSR